MIYVISGSSMLFMNLSELYLLGEGGVFTPSITPPPGRYVSESFLLTPLLKSTHSFLVSPILKEKIIPPFSHFFRKFIPPPSDRGGRLKVQVGFRQHRVHIYMLHVSIQTIDKTLIYLLKTCVFMQIGQNNFSNQNVWGRPP